jgi:hypothetical protein
MLANSRALELLGTAAIVLLCLVGALNCLVLEQLINALGFLIASLAIPMIFWYMNRIATAHEEGVRQTAKLLAEREASLPREDTFEQHKDSPFHPPLAS